MSKEACHLKTEIVIDRPVSEVHKVFHDFEKYPQWNPSIKSIQVLSGNINDMNTKPVLSTLIATPPSSEGYYKTEVVLNSLEEFRMVGRFLSIQIIRYFKFESHENMKTKFII